LNEKTEPIVPELGETATLAVTLKTVNGCADGIRSFPGVPLTCSVQLMLVVAKGPTTKLPCATCGDVIEQVEELNRLLFGVRGP
jgi:hypothetical protein